MSGLLFILIIIYWFPVGQVAYKVVNILTAGLNPMIYVILDKKLRQRCFHMLPISKTISIFRTTTTVQDISMVGRNLN